jgi:hypothetical protein
MLVLLAAHVVDSGMGYRVQLVRRISPAHESVLSLRNELHDAGGFRYGHVALIETVGASRSSERHADVRRINGYPVCDNSAINPDQTDPIERI